MYRPGVVTLFLPCLLQPPPSPSLHIDSEICHGTIPAGGGAPAVSCFARVPLSACHSTPLHLPRASVRKDLPEEPGTSRRPVAPRSSPASSGFPCRSVVALSAHIPRHPLLPLLHAPLFLVSCNFSTPTGSLPWPSVVRDPGPEGHQRRDVPHDGRGRRPWLHLPHRVRGAPLPSMGTPPPYLTPLLPRLLGTISSAATFSLASNGFSRDHLFGVASVAEGSRPAADTMRRWAGSTGVAARFQSPALDYGAVTRMDCAVARVDIVHLGIGYGLGVHAPSTD